MNLTELSAFCRDWGDLSTPFYHNHFVYASNGALAIRIPAENLNDVLPMQGSRNVEDLASKLDGYFASTDYSGQEPHTLSDFDFDLGTEPCSHCEGEGKLNAGDECDGAGEISHSTDYYDYEHECDSCGGKGYFTKSGWERKFPRSNVENASTEPCEECDGAGTTGANPYIFIDEAKFQGKLLKKFMGFEGATIKVGAVKKLALIEWDGGQGILMPMRNND